MDSAYAKIELSSGQLDVERGQNNKKSLLGGECRVILAIYPTNHLEIKFKTLSRRGFFAFG